ncbi:MAG TPA: F0F1 ATP synthase subunit alpha, partial [Patescibacteria group bacterium]|nr:F0F1 ATP synthase subunit alpha [Patescibacteria group bacterium]
MNEPSKVNVAPAHDIVAALREQIREFSAAPEQSEVGHVLEVGDGIAKIAGLRNVQSMEMLEFASGAVGVALNLEEDHVGGILLSGLTDVATGETVRGTGKLLSVPVGPEIVGRVVNPLGVPLDGKGPIKSVAQYPVEKVASGVMSREAVTVPLMTGIKAIDSMIPIGRGQRELIIGDRQTGKTAIAIDTIINQKGTGVICVYVAIGQKASKVAKLVSKLEEAGAMDYTIVVLASASDPASLQFFAPYAGCAFGEYFMDKGQDVLVVY